MSSKSKTLSQDLHPATEEEVAAFKRLRKRFGCALCGSVFKTGTMYRFVYANSTPGAHCGNFFVCSECDGADALERGIEDFKIASAAARRWGVYGPDWIDR